MAGKEKKEKAEGGKKKGKLPIIIALVAVLGGGGFFMTKGKKKEEPAIKLGKEIVELGEVLVNLKGGEAYARANIALQFKDGFDAKSLDKQKPVIRDAIIMVMGSKTLSELRSEVGKVKLKTEIASAINHSLETLDPEQSKPESKANVDQEKGEAEAKDGEHSKDEKTSGGRKHPEWDSDTGPVLKVYFADLVTQ